MTTLLRPPLYGQERKPNGGGQFLVNPESPYAHGLDVAWIGGHSALGIDACGNDFQVGGATSPTVISDEEGIVSDFANSVEDWFLFTSRLQLDSAEPWTIAFRIKPTSRTYNQFLLLESTDGDPIQFLFSTDTNYNFWVGQHDGVTTTLKAKSGAAATDFNFGEYNNIVVSYNGTNYTAPSNLTFYMNGSVVTPTTGGSSASMTNENRLGRTEGAGREYYGQWSGFRTWPRWEMYPDLALELSLKWHAPFGQPVEYDPVEVPYLIKPVSTGETITLDTITYNSVIHDLTLTESGAFSIVAETISYDSVIHDLDFGLSSPVDTIAYSYTLQDLTLLAGLGLTAETISYSMTLHDVTLTAPTTLEAETVSYSMNLNDITLTLPAAWANLPDVSGSWVDL